MAKHTQYDEGFADSLEMAHHLLIVNWADVDIEQEIVMLQEVAPSAQLLLHIQSEKGKDLV